MFIIGLVLGLAGGYFLHANQDAVIKFVDEKVGKWFKRSVALLLAGLTIGGQQWYIGHLNDKHEAYKSKVIAATVKAEQAAIATTKGHCQHRRTTGDGIP